MKKHILLPNFFHIKLLTKLVQIFSFKNVHIILSSWESNYEKFWKLNI